MATSSPWSIRRLDSGQGHDRRVAGVFLDHVDQLQNRRRPGGLVERDGDVHGHDDGTSTRVPAVMPDPLIWTRVLLYRPVVTPTRWLVLPVTTSTPNPPPCEGQQGVDRHGQHVGGPLRGDVDVHRGLVQGGPGRGAVQGDGDRHGRGVSCSTAGRAGRLVGRAAAGAGAAAARAGGDVADRLDVPAHRRGAVGQHDRHRVAGLDQVLLGHVQVDGDDGGGAGRRQHGAAPTPAAATPAPAATP